MEHLKTTMEEVRIEAQPEIVVQMDMKKISDISTGASLVFLPFRLKGDTIAGPVDGFVESLLLRLPTTALVLASEDIELDAEPEDGTAAEMAAATDALQDTDKKAAAAQKTADAAHEIAETARAKLMAFIQGESAIENKAEMDRLEEAAQKAEIEAEKAFRKAAKAKAKALDAEKNAETVGVKKDIGQDTSRDA
jgi:hypothetical protein